MTAATCLALNIFFEARNEPLDGQLAVAEVTLNRVADHRYPDTVCEVVWEHKQFSWTHDGIHDDPTRMDYLERQSWSKISALAEGILDGSTTRLGMTSTHYHNTSVSIFWAAHYEYDTQIGKHLFYTNETPYK